MSLDLIFDTGGDNLISHNITHNLTGMARAIGLYYPLRHSTTVGKYGEATSHYPMTGIDLLEPAVLGLHRLRAEPTWYREFEPDNGWGYSRELYRLFESCSPNVF